MCEGGLAGHSHCSCVVARRRPALACRPSSVEADQNYCRHVHAAHRQRRSSPAEARASRSNDCWRQSSSASLRACRRNALPARRGRIIALAATPSGGSEGRQLRVSRFGRAGASSRRSSGGDNDGHPLGHSSHVRFVLLQRSHTPAEAPSDSPVVAFARFVLRDDIDPANCSGAAMYL
jgi:hypothetical protein